MAKINHIEMGEDVMALNDVQVKKGFMGWSVKLTYKPTQSKIQIKEKEYTAEDGKSFRTSSLQLLQKWKLPSASSQFQPSAWATSSCRHVFLTILSLLPSNSSPTRISATSLLPI